MSTSKQLVTPSSSVDDVREIRFAAKQASKQIHRCQRQYFICKSLREEIAFVTKLINDFTIPLATPLGHIVPRTHEFVAAGDACPLGGGGWSTNLRFWWHIHFATAFPATLGGGQAKVSINVLETIVVIINYAAAICACHVDGIDLSTFPVLLNFCDNTSACSWINRKCRNSIIGRRLGRLFAGLLLGSQVGIQCEWISTHENVIADEISRLKKLSMGNFDFSQLLSKFPKLQNCRRFHPSATLLSMISNVLEKDALPDPIVISKLTPMTLGSFSSRTT